MKNFELEVFLEINGIGAVSGLIYDQNSIYTISDNANFIYHYTIADKVMKEYAINKNPSKNIIKKEKPDFEAITKKEHLLYVFGSGSTANRNTLIIFDTKNQTYLEKNLSLLYQKLKTTASLSDNTLNIEGALFNNNDLYLFQRGNGATAQNGIFVIRDFDTRTDPQIQFHAIILPVINGAMSSFTDAILVEKTIYFLATAEDTISTYDDGQIVGSAIGTINIDNIALTTSIKITDQRKFEGLTLYKNSNSQIEFLICEDNDTEVLRSKIYKLKIDL